ncbi:hypothetical protein VHEMI01297 [[Torrubiella] hemipterigena]|uniref:Alginate lyase 2 domain-containing protein n=1 Tax=[Torrubiella] hemipterigena TaxID=1531966 RepID=A0A0A1T4F1_9HYPO|nr:hypothetical protein VHEMI01297 [[Torrubiella] hemipterigena]
MVARSLFLSLATAAVGVLAVDPVGNGPWTSVNPSFNVQRCGGGTATDTEFQLPAAPDGSTDGPGCSNGHLRAERRYKNDYDSGVHQFGGQFVINSFGGNKVALKQTFNGGSGSPYFIMAVKNDGSLYSVEGGKTIASGVAGVGQTVTINTVHDTANNLYQVYVNGQLSYTDNGAPDGNFYDKYGAYTTNSGTGPIDVTWTNVQFWTS